MNKNKKLGFTLAEVLIVIGIIGVVAALTLPNLNHATGDKERVTKVKKIYSALTEAFDRAQAIYGDYTYASWFGGLTTMQEVNEKFGNRITEFIKVSKKCGLEANQGCFTAGTFKSLYGSEMDSLDDDIRYYKIITADSMSIIFESGLDSPQVTIYVDIDGPNKGPYTLGKDIFRFEIYEDNDVIHPFKLYEGWTGLLFQGSNAASWIIEHDNADYLKAAENGKCNDSDIVLNWTTNTSCH